MVWKALTMLIADRSWKAVVQRLRLGLWKQSWHQAWEVWRVMEASRQTLAVVSWSHPCVPPAPAELPLQRRGSCSPLVLQAGGSWIWDSSDLRACQMLSSISPGSSCFYKAEAQFVASKMLPGV